MGTSLALIGHDFELSAGAGYTLFRPLIPTAPLIIDSSHHSEFFPKGAKSYVECRPETWSGIDRHIDTLVEPLRQYGSVLINALSRVYIDMNRAADAMNPACIQGPHGDFKANLADAYTHSKLGLIPTTGINLSDPFADRPSVDVLRERLTYWRAYHDTLRDLIDTQWAQSGESLHLSIHSYQGDKIREKDIKSRSPVILSTLDHTSAAADVTEKLQECFEKRGYYVLVNKIFLGNELVRQHGNPAIGKHSIQVEIDRRLYMDPDTTYKRYPEKFQKLQDNMRGIIKELCDFMNDRAVTRKLEQTAAAAPDPLQMAAQ